MPGTRHRRRRRLAGIGLAVPRLGQRGAAREPQHQPGPTDLPELQTILVPTYEPTGPYGAKSVSEICINGPLPALSNAIFDAVGVRVDQIPVHPDAVLKGLELKAKGKDPRVGPTKYPDVDFGTPLNVPTLAPYAPNSS